MRGYGCEWSQNEQIEAIQHFGIIVLSQFADVE